MAAKKTPAAKSAKKRSAAAQTKNKENAMKQELIALFTVVAGALIAVFLYAPSGIVGEWIKTFFLGIGGVPVYLLPLLVIANGIHRAVQKKYEESFYKYILICISIFVLSAIFHLFSGGDKCNPLLLTSMAQYYEYGAYGMGGGLIGGIITDIFRNLGGSIATGIILFTVLIVLIMVLTKWSPVKALLRCIVRLFMGAKDTGKKISEEVKAEREIRAKQEEPPLKPMKRKRINFSDEEVTRTSKTEELPQKPYDEEGYLPESLREVEIESEVEPGGFDNIDEILNQALPDMEEPVVKPSKPAGKAAVSAAETAPWEKPEPESINIEETAAEPENETVVKPEKVEGMIDVTEEIEEELYERIPYTYPDVNLLDDFGTGSDNANSRNELKETAQKLISTLKSFNVEAKLLNVSKGPTVTRYELKPGEGVKVSKIVGLSDDIALRLAASGVRIEAPIPNKEAIGIEIPNKSVDMVHVREVIDSKEFRDFPSKLAFAVGKDITGRNIVFDIGKMPHVLIAGATGSGKSVCINTLITSLIYKADPNEVKLLMVDPKVVELGIYNGIPHLLIPVVTDPRRASGALYWAVQEMVRRYSLFAENSVRDIKGYNNMILDSGKENTMPHIVIIIDELADLMMVAPNEVEDSICRLAQMARAAGMHLVIATQRPSVDVITGIIKANIPSRIAFAVSSQVDSRTILDSGGAEKLLGRGDMLFNPVGASKPTRLQGCFISDKEVERVVEFVKGQADVKYDEDIIEKIDNGKPVNINDNKGDAGDNDELLPKAIEIAVDTGKISASYIQRRLKVGFSRAARIVDQMEERGWIGPPDGSKPREVLITKEEYLEMSMR